MKKANSGDTLIEVLIAFAILSVIMATAFNGALSGYKSSQAAQSRTIGAFLVQYQIEALKSYRDSISWDSVGEPSYSQGYSSANPAMPKMNEIGSFCMIKSDAPFKWRVESDLAKCNTEARGLAPGLQNATMVITKVGGYAGNNIVEYTYLVEVKWLPINSTNQESSKGRVIISK